MRFIVVGAGAVGGTVGGLLHQAGHDVVLVARGEHGRAMSSSGLRLQRGGVETVLEVTVAFDIGDVALTPDDVLLLTTKSQHTASLVQQMASLPVGDALAGDVLPIACVQNAVANELIALRRFARVYGVCVQLPATHLEPGVVASHGQPRPGILPVGRFPHGTDDTADAIAAALRDAGFQSESRADIMPWKYAKLLANLSNGTRVALAPPDGDAESAAEVHRTVRAEGEAALAAAGIAWVGEEAFIAERGGLADTSRSGQSGSSTWQSLARGTGSTEVDYLNGEIVTLGRLHGVPTPANLVVQRIVNQLTLDGGRPGAFTPTELLRMIEGEKLG